MNGDTITSSILSTEARKKVRAGVNKVYNAIKLTLGPEGLNALLPRSYNRGPRLTNDGVTVSENIQLLDEHERLAADFFKEGSKKTNELVGDGTTTTAVIAGTLINRIFDELDTEAIPVAGNLKKKGVRGIRKEMKDTKDVVIEKIGERAVPIKDLDDLKKISVISIGKEDGGIADTVAEMVWEVARDEDGEFVDNHIDVTEGYKGEVETEVVKGMRFPAKVAHRAFVNKPERFEMEASDVPVWITNHKLDNPHDLVSVIENAIKGGVSKLAIFAPHFSPLVIKSMVETTKNGFFCYPVLCPALRTDQLEDLATYTGATVVDKDSSRGLRSTTIALFGFAEKVTVKDTEAREDAILMGGKGDKEKVKERVETLKGQLTEAKNELSRMATERRIANLQSAVGVIRVGATTNAELLYLKLKIEDGVFACKAALQEGYVKGGGLCLKDIAEELDENVLTEALKAPYQQIQDNAGGDLEIDDDVIDPAKVVRLEVEHGVSVASSMITTGIIISELRGRTEYEGLNEVSRAVAKGVYYDAKHRGLINEAEEEAQKDQEQAFEEAMFMADKD
jgi:chaperonin GroEL